jgi:hypothetical protein
MKHLLAVILCVVLLFLIAVNVYAGTEIGGNFAFKYKMLDGQDETWANLNITSTVNEKTTAYLTIAITGTPPRDFNANNFYVIDKEAFGTFTVGSFSYGTGNLSILDSTFQGLRSNIGVKFEWPCLETLTLKSAYFFREQVESDEKSIYHAHALGCDYRFKKYFIGLNYIQPGLAPGGTETPGYTLNLSIDPNPASKIYLHYGRDKNKDLKGIMGYYTAVNPRIPLLIAAECSFIPIYSNYIANYDYGAFLQYEFSKKAFARYTYVAEGLTPTSIDLIVSFYF